MKTFNEIKKLPNLLIVNTTADGGMGELFRAGKRYGTVIWSNGGGWEHVSVCPFKRSHTPSWDEMCSFKDMFFYDYETVIQYHPAKDEYVNNLPNCLHLWRPITEKLPTPPSIMVGTKKCQTSSEIRAAIRDVIQGKDSGTV